MVTYFKPASAKVRDVGTLQVSGSHLFLGKEKKFNKKVGSMPEKLQAVHAYDGTTRRTM